MTVRLYEWDKTETGWAWIEITDNKVVNLKLRDENNLIQINEDNEVYTDLQLLDGITPSDDLPVGVETGRVLVADGRPVTWTLVLAKTTSWDEIKILYWDDGEIMVDNGTGTWKNITTAYFKTQAEYDSLPARKNTDGNLYIIVDSHHGLLEYSQLIALGSRQTIVSELNSNIIAYYNKYLSENHLYEWTDVGWHVSWALSSDGTESWCYWDVSYTIEFWPLEWMWMAVNHSM